MLTAVGHAEAIGHHGELIQGLFEDENSQFRRALVSLPCRQLKSKATFKPSHDNNLVCVTPCSREKARRAAEFTVRTYGRHAIGGSLEISSNIPLGHGMGSSTADVLASILAVLDWLRVDATTDEIMQIAIRAEIACDSTLFNQQAVLFAHRDGIVMEAFRKALPRVSFISIDTAPHTPVKTLEFEPAHYHQQEIEAFRPIRSLLRTAVNTADARLLGRAATASARINERFLPKPRLKDIEAIGARFGAIGIQVAHSGTVVGLMFDGLEERTPENIQRAAGALRRADFEPVIFAH